MASMDSMDAQAEELLRTRCTGGWLIITRDTIRIERKGVLGAGSLSLALPRQSLTGVTYRNTVAPMFGFGGGGTLTFTATGGNMLEAAAVAHKDAQRIKTLLGYT